MPYLDMSGIHTRKVQLQFYSRHNMYIYKHNAINPVERAGVPSLVLGAPQRDFAGSASPLDRGSTGNVSHS